MAGDSGEFRMKTFLRPGSRVRRASAASAVASLLVFCLVLLAFGPASAQAPEDDLKLDEESSPSPAKGKVLPADLVLEELGDKPAARKPEPVIPKADPAPAANDKFSGNFAEVGVTDIRYVAKKSGGSVVIETSQPATFFTREVPNQNQAVIEIANAQLPERLKTPYIAKDSNQNVTSISAYQERGSSTVRIVVQYKSNVRADVRQEGRTLVVATNEAVAEVDSNPTLGRPQAAPRAIPEPEEQGARILPRASISDSDGNLRFYGKPISIEVRDMSIRDVIGVIADQSGANIVLSQDVEGNISLKLREIPWDQALLTVMKARGLGYIRQGTILRVAPLKTLQEESESARRVSEAQKAAEPLRVKIIPVGYARVGDLEKQIAAFLTRDRGRVVADPRTNALIVTDTVEVLERVSQLIRAIDLPPLQVLIEGKVVEAGEDFSRTAGVRWLSQGNQLDLGSKQLTMNTRTNFTLPDGGGLFDFRIGQFDLLGDITASLGLLEQQNQVKIVSSPRVVTLNNETATILQGQNIPLTSTTISNGVPVTSTTYQPIEMKLDVLPQVTSENDVLLQLKIKREFTGTRQVGVAPDINRREAQTKVLVRNGQTAVVGGIYQADQTQGETGIPWLKEVPVLGWLFKSRSTSNTKNELLVFLTPRILNSDTSMQKENNL